MSKLGTIREDYELNGISLKFINLEEQFRELKTKAIIVNDLADEFSVGKTVDVLNNLLRTHYESDELNTIPSCSEGCTTGRYNYDEDNPVICDICETEVVMNITQRLEPQLWMRVPGNIHGFLHPRLYKLMIKDFSTTNFCLITYLTVPTYSPNKANGFVGGSKQVPELIDLLQSSGIKRGINYFIEDFDKIIDIIFSNPRILQYKHTISDSRRLVKDYTVLFNMYRDCLFTRYLPFPSRAVMVSERGGNAEFIDSNMGVAFDAPKTIASIEMELDMLSNNVLQSRVMKVVKAMADYYEGYYSITSASKKGILRGQHGGTRSFFSGRAVISPLGGEHEYDELHVPWSWAVTLFAVHIENKLLRRNYTSKEIFRKIDKATVRFDDEIYEIINELIDESPEGGIPVSMLRNPTLVRGSNQYFRITKVHTNINDNAIGISVLVIKAPNGDFDGD